LIRKRFIDTRNMPHEKAEVEAMMAKALKSRPMLPNVGLKAA
jgi:hypothetical protein